MKNKLFIAMLYCLVFGAVTKGIAQNNYLNKRISVSFSHVQVQQALASIARAGDFNFSYNNNIIDASEVLTGNYNNKTVYRILKDLFGEKYTYNAIGNHIIMMENIPSDKPNRNDKNKEYPITGYIFDSRTGKKIKKATVYEINGQLASTTNELGYYSLTLPLSGMEYGINFSKSGYLDTVIFIHPTNQQQVNITLKPREHNLNKIQAKDAHISLDNVHQYKMVKWVVPEESKIISQNLQIHEPKLAQISFLPFLGSNHKISGSVDNVLSFNILAGYSNGVKGFELGGLLNIDREYMNGFQLAGVGNFVGGNSFGMQIAGASNVNMGTFRGVQTAGISNILLDTLTGMQIGGIFNILKGEMHGVQLSGVNNVSFENVDGAQLTGVLNVAFKDVNSAQISGIANFGKNIEGIQLGGIANAAWGDVNKLQLAGIANFGKNIGGVQLAGVTNVALGDVNFAQIAGIVNFTKNIDGVQLAGIANGAYGKVNKSQISGIVNFGNSVNGLQVAGICNVVLHENNSGQISGIVNFASKLDGVQLAGITSCALEEVDGFQASGVVNYTKKLKGVQLGFINICDTVERGAPIGLMSIVFKGYNKIELQNDESFWASVLFKPGVKHFYNIFKVGVGSDSTFQLGYGVGTAHTIKNKWGMNVDLTQSAIFRISKNNNNYVGNLFRLNLNFDYQLFKYVSIFAGPSINIYTTKNTNSENFTDISFYPFYDKDIHNQQVRVWVGYSVGFRFK